MFKSKNEPGRLDGCGRPSTEWHFLAICLLSCGLMEALQVCGIYLYAALSSEHHLGLSAEDTHNIVANVLARVGSTLITRSIDTERYFWFKKKILNITNGVSSKSIENRQCACTVERHTQTVSSNLNFN